MSKNENERVEIDDLLEKVSPALIAGYEKVNLLEGVTLAVTNEKYKVAFEKIEKFTLNSRRLMMLALVSAVWVTAFTPLIFGYFVSVFVFAGTCGVIILGFVPFAFLSFGPPAKEARECEKVVRQNRPVLNAFRQSVKDLDLFSPHGACNENSIHGTLVARASSVVGVQIIFRQLCEQKAPTENIVQCGTLELRNKERFTRAFEGTKKFGLVFEKAKLFAVASKNF